MTAARALGACALAAGLASASAQSIEPRAYANAPVGVNFLIAGYAQTRGGLSFDPSAPLSDAHLNSYNGVFAYARVLDLWGQSGKIDAVVPYARLAGKATSRANRWSASSTALPTPRSGCRSISTARRR